MRGHSWHRSLNDHKEETQHMLRSPYIFYIDEPLSASGFLLPETLQRNFKSKHMLWLSDKQQTELRFLPFFSRLNRSSSMDGRRGKLCRQVPFFSAGLELVDAGRLGMDWDIALQTTLVDLHKGIRRTTYHSFPKYSIMIQLHNR